MSRSDFVDFYEILEVEETATDQEIMTALQKERRICRSRQNAPDLTRRQDVERRMAELAEAEKVLLDSTRRRQFDLILQEMNTSQSESTEVEDYGIAAEEALEAEQYTRAMIWAKSALDEYDSKPSQITRDRLWCIRGVAAVNASPLHREAGLDAIRQAIDIRPDVADHYYQYAKAHQGNDAQAKEIRKQALRQSIDIRPDFAEYYFELAMAHVEQENNWNNYRVLDEQKRVAYLLDKAITLEPTHFGMRFTRAMWHYDAEEYRLALPIFEQLFLEFGGSRKLSEVVDQMGQDDLQMLSQVSLFAGLSLMCSVLEVLSRRERRNYSGTTEEFLHKQAEGAVNDDGSDRETLERKFMGNGLEVWITSPAQAELVQEELPQVINFMTIAAESDSKNEKTCHEAREKGRNILDKAARAMKSYECGWRDVLLGRSDAFVDIPIADDENSAKVATRPGLILAAIGIICLGVGAIIAGFVLLGVGGIMTWKFAKKYRSLVSGPGYARTARLFAAPQYDTSGRTKMKFVRGIDEQSIQIRESTGASES